MDKVLIVDDDDDLRGMVRDVLKGEGFIVTEAHEGKRALELFQKETPDVVLLDLKMPGMSGLDVLKKIMKTDGGLPVVMLSGHGDVHTAVSAIKSGAYDFIEKPPQFDRLLITLRRAVEKRHLQKKVVSAQDSVRHSLERMLGSSPSMAEVIKRIQQVAPTEVSVIIEGETGTGKSVVAEAIHNISMRAGRPFVSVDMGRIPDHLVESELFGYRKGAFTGADRNREGYFQAANSGTIFLDELENMSQLLQGKLLGFIENKVIYSLGSTRPINLDVRFISATNEDIKQSVRKKECREDLFYRLGEFILTVLPLRQRIEDIPYFAEKFLVAAASELNSQVRGIHEKAKVRLKSHSWPGNLRELKNMMKKAALILESDILDYETADLLVKGSEPFMGETSLSLKTAFRQLEEKHIRMALHRTKGNKTKAAALLEISYKNLFDKLKEYGIK